MKESEPTPPREPCYAHTHPEFSLKFAWAKTNADGLPALSVRDHCLNVGSVAKCLKGELSASILAMLPLSTELLVAAHDIGKISPGFLLKSPVWREKWQAVLELESPDQFEGFHAKVSQHFLSKQLTDPPLWLVSVGGHHGSYCSIEAGLSRTPREGRNEVFDVLKTELLEELISIFGPFSEEKVESRVKVHFFTGFMIFSDWIGSNEQWFPLSQEIDSELTLTQEVAARRASEAVGKIGWHLRGVKSDLSFGELFRTEESCSFKPRPLQSSLFEAVDAPGLYILEAPMGGGKTEAALAAAYRRWTEGDESGLYFALPTQLTSNRIHERVKQFLGNVVSGDSPLSIVHGNAWLSPERMTAVRPSTSGIGDDANESNRWFSDNRKAMLAPFGTGTIDQALMATMPVKFSALRLFALGGKVVVIDEVHSYDPYTSALVDRMVECLLEVGSTVIILSATLTRRRRAKLVKAAGAQERNVTDAYPLLTKVKTGSEVAESIAIEGVENKELCVGIERIPVDDSNWITRATSAAESGACVLVIRNTVALAQESLRLLKSSCRSEDVAFGLLHSRFPQFRRNENEELWMEKLGKGNSKRPSGCILVGTQVLEQSVDIDSDLLITDLAPSDLILQRMGRLHRHRRTRPAGFETARCLILDPEVDWTLGEKEIKKAIGPSAYVYSPYVLYQAQRVWSQLDSVSLPGGIRAILEDSDRVPAEMPSGAIATKRTYDQETRKQINTALNRDLFEVPVPDTEGMETRWGTTPTAYVVLLRAMPIVVGRKTTVSFMNGAARAIFEMGFDFELARELHLNAVRVPRYLVADTLKSESAPRWLSIHMSNAVVAVCPEGSTVCELLDSPEVCGYVLNYDRHRGLSYEKNEDVKVEYSEPEEDAWY